MRQDSMIQRFVVLTTQRTGSTWLIDMLNSHPDIDAFSELFLEGAEGTPTWGGRKDFHFYNSFRKGLLEHGRQINERDVVNEYLDQLYTERSGCRIVGFKLMYGQAGAHPAIAEYLRDHDARIIHLFRRNLLDILISKEAAAARDLYHSRAARTASTRVELDLVTLMRRLQEEQRSVEEARRRFPQTSCKFFEVAYEDLSADRSAFEPVLDFLDAEPCTSLLRSDLKKIIRQPHHLVIGNYRQVKRALKGTRFSEMLD